MDPLESFVEHMAFFAWTERYREPFAVVDAMAKELSGVDGQFGPFLKTAREALHLSTHELAVRLRITQQAYSRLEKRQANGRITVRSLSQIAAALNCDLICGFRPKSKQTFSQVIWDQLQPIARNAPALVRPRSFYRANALSSVAARLMFDGWFRRHMNWRKRGVRLKGWSIRRMNRETAQLLLRQHFKQKAAALPGHEIPPGPRQF